MIERQRRIPAGLRNGGWSEQQQGEEEFYGYGVVFLIGYEVYSSSKGFSAIETFL